MSQSICLYQHELYESFFEDLAAKTNPKNILSKLDLLKKSYDINIKKIEKQLIENNINISNIKDIINKHSKDIDLNPKNIVKSVISNFNIGWNEIKVSLPRDLSLSLITLSFIIFVSMFLSIIVVAIGISLGLTPEICGYIIIIFISPLVEEYGKYISIKHNYTGTYFVVFNIFEFFGYIFNMLNIGIHLIPVIMIRSLAVMMHAITTYIQYHARKNSVNKDETSKMALLFAIIIHFFWNLGAVVISKS